MLFFVCCWHFSLLCDALQWEQDQKKIICFLLLWMHDTVMHWIYLLWPLCALTGLVEVTHWQWPQMAPTLLFGFDERGVRQPSHFVLLSQTCQNTGVTQPPLCHFLWLKLFSQWSLPGDLIICQFPIHHIEMVCRNWDILTPIMRNETP